MRGVGRERRGAGRVSAADQSLRRGGVGVPLPHGRLWIGPRPASYLPSAGQGGLGSSRDSGSVHPAPASSQACSRVGGGLVRASLVVGLVV